VEEMYTSGEYVPRALPPGIASAQGFLERWYDSGLEPPPLDRPTIVDEEVQRLLRSIAIVSAAGAIPRRLGGDATSGELAIDKKRARRVAWALNQTLIKWKARPGKPPMDDLIRVSAANLIWGQFISEHQTHVLARIRLVATWAIRENEQRWGKSAVVRYENEVKWVAYAMRD
jgi:hypothetical protein